MSSVDQLDRAEDSFGAPHDLGADQAPSSEFVTMRVSGQLIGLPILSVQDILAPQKITRVPLAPREIAGSLNLRGRIVTAIDMRRRLGLPDRAESDETMSAVVEHDGELYSLIIDAVGDVLSLPDDRYERNPPTLDSYWAQVCNGVYRLDDELLVVMDVGRILNFAKGSAVSA